MVNVNIENIIASAKLAESFNLDDLAISIENSKYNPDEVPAVALHRSDPKTAILIFSSGKATFTGAKTLSELETLVVKIISELEKTGFIINQDPEIEINSIIASSDFNMDLNLVNIVNNPLFEDVEYNPGEFPGVIYRINELSAVFLIFSNGKIVCTGFKKIEDLTRVMSNIEDKLSSIGAL
jgi:transcription initiation factor TFIID TATA-box-binding protein